MLPAEAEWTGFPHARSVVRTLTEPLEEPSGGGGRQEQARLWISSLEAEATGARRFAELVRGHWNIENASHRQRDVLWREDHQRMKHHGRAHVLASLRQLALCLHCGLARRAADGTRQPNCDGLRVSHRAKRFSHRPQAAFPLILSDPRE